MSSIIKTILASSAIVLLSNFAYSAFNTLLASPNIEIYLEAQGYTTLFNAKKESFTKWKRNYSTYKEELEKHIPELKDANTAQGGYLLKQWCKVKLDQVFEGENYDYFDLTKKYCTINIQNAILEEDDVRTIDEIDIEKREKLFPAWKELLNKCKEWFRVPFRNRDRELFQKAKGACSSKDWI